LFSAVDFRLFAAGHHPEIINYRRKTMRIRNWVLATGAMLAGVTPILAQSNSSNYAWRASAVNYVREIPQDGEAYYDAQHAGHSQGTAYQYRLEDPNLYAIGSGNLANLPPAPMNLPSAVTSRPPLSVRDMGDPPPESGKPSWCNLGPERRLFNTTPGGISLGGWTQVGYHTRTTDLFNDRPDRFNLHQQWFFLERQTGCQRNWGFRADMAYGIDAQNFQAFGNPVSGNPSGWDNGWDRGSYGWALPQAYVNYENDLWNVKMGKFFSPFGFEQIASPQNFFYSRSFARNYIEPYTMTGMLAERRISDRQSLLVGATAGWETGFDQNSSGLTGITGTRWDLSDNLFFSSTASWGNTGIRGDGVLSSNVLEVGLSNKTYYVLQGDVLNLDDVNEFSVVQYLFHSVNPCLQLGSRLEWWKSNQLFSSTQSTWSYTSGINFRRNANFMIRPESRYDWGAGAANPAKITFGVDGIVTF
jgi:hypothetical protein